MPTYSASAGDARPHGTMAALSTLVKASCRRLSSLQPLDLSRHIAHQLNPIASILAREKPDRLVRLTLGRVALDRHGVCAGEPLSANRIGHLLGGRAVGSIASGRDGQDDRYRRRRRCEATL